MRQKSMPGKEPATQVVKNIRRATRRHFSAEDKIRIVLEGLRGEDSIAELCRREGIVQNLYYRWSKDFLEAGKKRLAGDTARAATSDEVKDLRREAGALKEVHKLAAPRTRRSPGQKNILLVALRMPKLGDETDVCGLAMTVAAICPSDFERIRRSTSCRTRARRICAGIFI
jgi:transposase